MPLTKTYRIRQLGDSDKRARDIEACDPEEAGKRFASDHRKAFEDHNGKQLTDPLFLVVDGSVFTVMSDETVTRGLTG